MGAIFGLKTGAPSSILLWTRTCSTLEYSLRPEISVLLKFHFGFGIWCLSVILSWIVVQFLQSGRAGVWEVIPFKRVSRGYFIPILLIV